MTTQTTPATALYLARVRAELADLPAPERDEVLEDVAGHLVELSTEYPAEPTLDLLEARLGPPQQYADHLRTAAGYPTRPDDYGPTSRGTAALVWLAVSTALTPLLLIIWFAVDPESTRAVLWWLAAGLVPAVLSLSALRRNDPSAVIGTPLWRRNERRLRRLAAAVPTTWRRELIETGQPVWWFTRGILGGISLCGMLTRSTDAPLLVVAGLLGALASIWLGRASQRNRYWLWLLVPMNSVAILAVAILLIGGTSAWGHDGYNFSGVHSTY